MDRNAQQFGYPDERHPVRNAEIAAQQRLPKREVATAYRQKIHVWRRDKARSSSLGRNVNIAQQRLKVDGIDRHAQKAKDPAS